MAALLERQEELKYKCDSANEKVYVNHNLNSEVKKLRRLTKVAKFALWGVEGLLFAAAAFTTVAFFLTIAFGMHSATSLMVAVSLKLVISALFLTFFLFDAEKLVEVQEDKIREEKEKLKEYARCIQFLNHWKVNENHRFDLSDLQLYPIERFDLLKELVESLEGMKREPDSSEHYQSALSALFALESYQRG